MPSWQFILSRKWSNGAGTIEQCVDFDTRILRRKEKCQKYAVTQETTTALLREQNWLENINSVVHIDVMFWQPTSDRSASE